MWPNRTQTCWASRLKYHSAGRGLVVVVIATFRSRHHLQDKDKGWTFQCGTSRADVHRFAFSFFPQVLETGGRFTARGGSGTLGYGVVTKLHEDIDVHAWEMEKKKAKKERLKKQREEQEQGY